MKANSCHAGEEKGGLWTQRLVLQGTRVVVALELSVVQQFMKTHNVLEPLHTWGKTLSVATCRALISETVALSATLQPGDVVFIPPGLVVWEECTSDADCLGLKWAMVCPRDRSWCANFRKVAGKKLTSSTHVSKHVVPMLPVQPPREQLVAS